MITLIHGDNIPASRKYFSDLKAKYTTQKLYDGEQITLTDLMQVLEGNNLFDETPGIFIENFFTKRKPGTEKDSILELVTSRQDYTLVFWEQKEIAKKEFSKFSSIKPQLFDLPKVLFKFLDSISPNNGKTAVMLFHESIRTQAAELVFFMIVRKFRILLGLLDEPSEPIDEVRSLQSWQKDKLVSQAGFFGKEKLLKIYESLFKIESDIKTGNSAVTITSLIDFFLLGI